MRVFRLLISVSCLFVFPSALVLAQDAPPKADANCARGASTKTPTSKAKAKPKKKAPQGPFLVQPYLQLGHTQAPGKLVLLWHAPGQRRRVDCRVQAADRPALASRQGPVRQPRRGGRNRAAPDLSPGPDGSGTG